MGAGDSGPSGPDFTQGIDEAQIPDGGMLGGHAGDAKILVARSGGDFFAVSAECTHYHGPLAEGLLCGNEVRCPWHHARFDLRTGEAIAAPALDPLQCWRVARRDGKIFVGEKIAAAATSRR